MRKRKIPPAAAKAATEGIFVIAVFDDQKSSVRPVETALSVAPPIVSLN
jgi:hypothetical protein